MSGEIDDIRDRLISIAQDFIPPLRIRNESPGNFELAGRKEVMQGKQKVDGYYFCSIVPKPKDVRLYFFPIYTHAGHFDQLSADMKKFLKGKSCFHIKHLDEALENEISGMMKKGVELYQKDDLI